METIETNYAIETSYRGYMFRSRLEARWAVFFDIAGIRYQYEPEGYKTKAGLYLPDFKLPDLECFIEIKSESPSDQENKKAVGLAKCTKMPVFIFWGEIPSPIEDDPFESGDSAFMYTTDGWDNYHRWCQCPDCRVLGIEFMGYADRLKHLPKCKLKGSGKFIGTHTPVLGAAYSAARAARFNRATRVG